MTPIEWVYAERGGRLHDHMCSAALDWGGYTLVGDDLYEVLYAEVADHERVTFRWRVRPAAHRGTA